MIWVIFTFRWLWLSNNYHLLEQKRKMNILLILPLQISLECFTKAYGSCCFLRLLDDKQSHIAADRSHFFLRPIR